jgi:deoxycytidylate deaminase/dephospho-CoA kinase
MPDVDAVIGITGAFGSGCTTAVNWLRDERGLRVVSLSELLRKEWTKAHQGTPTREQLQRLGDELRENHSPGFLAELASKTILEAASKGEKLFAVDSIRNLGEVRLLRSQFGFRFTLLGVLAAADARWDRIGATAYTNKGLTQRDFLLDDARDRNEEIPTGQQVELCVDQADMLVHNSGETTLKSFKNAALDLVDLTTGRKLRRARREEIFMNMAYAAAHSSKCLKRNVGAVIVDLKGQVVGVGYNENPIGTHPCVEEPEYDGRCYRDIVRNRHFKQLSAIGALCPVCGKPLTDKAGPPWKCDHCKTAGKKTNLEAYFFPDRALNWCTAIHAEVWAILAAAERARGGELYCTTFPCFQCSEKIIQAGLTSVQFTEAYPDAEGQSRLKLAKVNLTQFQGVRSSSFERVFSQIKPQ